MLTTSTKKKIDTARDILVGKIPMPTSQVEQITLALIYKFMADMDKKARELGDTSGFFSNGYEQYSWEKIINKSLAAHERVKLYSEGLEKMSLNPHIPQLFRDIFRNAFLPFKDPETLKLFLDVIDQFEYDHSEELGNAFEYLLQVMGSQGDAGQFRTPRHIIDFIVKVVDPQKTDRILDPACGTAGFLISAYNHLKKNGLTNDEMKKVSQNFVGYDISQDMQRLSLVNMYLHHFPDPHIYEYDTLTSEERWNDNFDVILANPPFMTPKGGIRPHNRFSVPSNRAEVLFVDYIMEHLSVNGRAGVIVPEGIIFQSQNAYKQLRKMMVDDDYLWAVVSLPAGVFQPYSGVKTTVLLFDRQIAKKTNKVLFLKVESDGYDLGAQRRKLDIPDAEIDLTWMGQELVNTFKPALLAEGTIKNTKWFKAFGESAEGARDGKVIEVLKSEISTNGDYNLSGDRYKRNSSLTFQTHQKVTISEICEIVTENVIPSDSDSNIFYVGLENIQKNTGNLIDVGKVTSNELKSTKSKFEKNDILFAKLRPNLNKVWLANRSGICSTDILVIRPNQNKVDPSFLRYLFLSNPFNDLVLQGITGSQLPRVNKNYFSQIHIPLPVLLDQKKTADRLNQYKKIIDGAAQIILNYNPHLDLHPDWNWDDLGNHVDFVSGITISITQHSDDDGIPIISIADVTEDGHIKFEQVRKVKVPNKKISLAKNGDLLFNWRNGSKDLVGKTALFSSETPHAFASFLLGIRPKESFLPKFLWYLLNQFRREGRYLSFMRQNVNGLFNREELKVLSVPVPSIEEQKRIVNSLDEEYLLILQSATTKDFFEKKAKQEILKVWGK